MTIAYYSLAPQWEPVVTKRHLGSPTLNSIDLPGAENPALHFNPFEESYVEDPYPFFAAVRPGTRVFYSPKEECWVLTRYDDIRRVLLNPKQFSAANAMSTRPLCPMAGLAFAEANFNSVPTLTITDPPEHTRIRRLTNMVYTPARVAALEPFIIDYCARFVAERRALGRAEFMSEFAWELPSFLMFKLLDVPDADLPQVLAATRHAKLPLWSRPSETEQIHAAQGIGIFWKYIVNLVAARAREPRDDFVSLLLAARMPGLAPISEAEAASIFFGILVAGHETTTSLTVLALRLLLTHREAWEALGEDPTLIPQAVEEVLRFESPTTGLRRLTTEAVEVAGVPIPAGVFCLLGSANRDPAVFVQPEVFDIHRANAGRHVGFGLGHHLCLGAPLVRLVARVTIQHLSAHLPSLRLAPGGKARYAPNPLFRVPLNLDIEWDV